MPLLLLSVATMGLAGLRVLSVVPTTTACAEPATATAAATPTIEGTRELNRIWESSMLGKRPIDPHFRVGITAPRPSARGKRPVEIAWNFELRWRKRWEREEGTSWEREGSPCRPTKIRGKPDRTGERALFRISENPLHNDSGGAECKY